MNYLEKWIIPQIFFAPDGAEGGDPPADPIKTEDQIENENEFELNDETDLSTLDQESIEEIMQMDDIQDDKFLDWVKAGMKEPLLFKDIKQEKDVEKNDDAADHQDPEKDAVDKDKDESDDDKKLDAADNGKAKDPDKTDPDANAKVDKTADVKTITVNEEYIKKQIDNLKEQLKGKDPDLIQKQTANLETILNSVKDGVMDNRSLKNYINAQTYIKTLKTPFDKDWKPDAAVVNTPEYIEKAAKQKNKMIADVMRNKYPDYPADADAEAIKDFEDSLTNREYEEYKQIRDTRASEIGERYDRYMHLTENWEEIARDTVKSEVDLFVKKLNSFKVGLKDLGINSLDLDDKYYNEYLYKNLLFDEKGIPNPEIFDFVDNVIPIVKPFSLYNALLNTNLDLIIQAREAEARKVAYRKGIDDQPDPSLSDNTQNPGQRDEIQIDEASFEDDSISMEQHQNMLDKIKGTILRGKKR